MAVVRYAVLVALVIWIGRLLPAASAHGVDPWLHRVSYAAGGVMIVGLFVLKFVGPPPHGFVPRAGIVALMLALTFVDQTFGPPMIRIAVLALAFVLLAWYGRE